MITNEIISDNNMDHMKNGVRVPMACHLRGYYLASKMMHYPDNIIIICTMIIKNEAYFIVFSRFIR